MSLITVCQPAYKILVNIPGISLPQPEYSRFSLSRCSVLIKMRPPAPPRPAPPGQFWEGDSPPPPPPPPLSYTSTLPPPSPSPSRPRYSTRGPQSEIITTNLHCSKRIRGRPFISRPEHQLRDFEPDLSAEVKRLSEVLLESHHDIRPLSELETETE